MTGKALTDVDFGNMEFKFDPTNANLNKPSSSTDQQ